MRPPNVRLCAIILGAICTLAPNLQPAQAAFVASETAQVTPISGGLYLYSYTIVVDPTSTVYASEFDLAFSGTLDAATIINPNNFSFVYSPNDPTLGTLGSTLSFYAIDNGSGSSNIGISPGSMGTFSFQSNLAPVMGSFLATGFNSDTGDNGTIQGFNLTPGAVPEPSSLALSVLGLAGVVGLRGRSRRDPRV